MELIERIEAASGPCRELDAEIAVAVSEYPDARVVWANGCRWFKSAGPNRMPFVGAGGKGANLGVIFQNARYTASVDAALSLVDDGVESFVSLHQSQGRIQRSQPSSGYMQAHSSKQWDTKPSPSQLAQSSLSSQ